MSVPSPFASLQQTAMKELPKFTGEPDQKVTHFVDAIEQVTRVATTRLTLD
jgi:hypothetical protein